MAHVSLDDPQVDSGFEKMSGIGGAEGVNGASFFSDFCSNLGPAEGGLDTSPAPGQECVGLLHSSERQEGVVRFGLGGFRECASFVGGRVRRRSGFRNSRCAWYWGTNDRRFCGEGN